ncbi:GNAT family N-acetyltransferase [Microbacterium halotolerans]|uniref:GNAT family N-acetyltransferase n=1 Tax=Microbacterium halotolerans TaxID=246613 RepID=UPI000E6A9BFC|nr:GNAT family N-acetyltransferase [Microbacterium halotolerans]
MTDELIFRTAALTDVDRIVGLVQSAYRGDASRAGWTTEADLLDGQRTDAREVAPLVSGDPDVSRVMLACRSDAALACCHLENRGDHAYFGMFAVSPDAQSGGIGRALLAEAERVAAAWGRPEIRMTVITARGDLIAWYERRGYHRTGVISPFPYGDERFGVPRRDDLAFEELRKSL